MSTFSGTEFDIVNWGTNRNVLDETGISGANLGGVTRGENIADAKAIWSENVILVSVGID